MDIAWFPFDEQHCELVFASWRYPNTELNISVIEDKPVLNNHYRSSGEWKLVGNSYSCTHVVWFSVQPPASARGQINFFFQLITNRSRFARKR